MSDQIPGPRMWPGRQMFPAGWSNEPAGSVPGPREAAEAASSSESSSESATATATLPRQAEPFGSPPPAGAWYTYGAPVVPPAAPGPRERLTRLLAAVRAAGARAGAWPPASTSPAPAAAPWSPAPEALRGPWPKRRLLIAGGAAVVLATTAGIAVAASGGDPAGDAGRISSPGLTPGQGQGFGPGTGQGQGQGQGFGRHGFRGQDLGGQGGQGLGGQGFGPQDFGTLPGFAGPGGTTGMDPAADPAIGVTGFAT